MKRLLLWRRGHAAQANQSNRLIRMKELSNWLWLKQVRTNTMTNEATEKKAPIFTSSFPHPRLEWSSRTQTSIKLTDNLALCWQPPGQTCSLLHGHFCNVQLSWEMTLCDITKGGKKGKMDCCFYWAVHQPVGHTI